MAWLSYKNQAEQDTVISFSIKQAQRAKMLCKQHKAHIAKIQQNRHVEKNQKKDASFRRKLEKKINLIYEGETDLYNEFPDLIRDQANTISKNSFKPMHHTLCKKFVIRYCILWTIFEVYAGSVYLKYKTLYISRIHYRIASQFT